MMRPLGDTQNDVMKSLQRDGRGFWYSGCGWLWDTHSGTTKIMESLAKRGLVVKTAVPGNTARHATVRYDLTMAGKAYQPRR